MKKEIRIVVASPGDVQAERDALAHIIEELNDGVAADRNVRLALSRWETDTYPGFHPEGPQGLVDAKLRIAECDIVIGIFWKRFGTPVKDADSGTEHEFRTAYESWKKTKRPHVMMYFNQTPHAPQSPDEAEQWVKVLKFRNEFPPEGLWWKYDGAQAFERTARQHLSKFVRDAYPLPTSTAPPPAEPPVAPPPTESKTGRLEKVNELLETAYAKLAEFEREFVITADPGRRFEMRERMKEIREEIAGWEKEKERLLPPPVIVAPPAIVVPQLAPSFVNWIGMEFVLIPSGKFQMGSTEADERRWNGFLGKYKQNLNLSRERPAREVTIGSPFYLGKYPVTQGEWKAIMGVLWWGNPSWFKGDDRLPVERVSWDDCQEFIRRLNAKKDGYVYGLPSEAEWEYACRAGTTGDYAGELDEMGWYGDNSGDKRLDAYQAWTDAGYEWDKYYETFLKPNNCRTHVVGRKRANGFGLYDMHGNVWEWCQDAWHENYNGAPTDGREWEQGSDNRRVLRGGSWYDGADLCRSASRSRLAPSGRNSFLGLRVAVRTATN
jgi:formylglycine-generating enzyme required for sulfatase activity